MYAIGGVSACRMPTCVSLASSLLIYMAYIWPRLSRHVLLACLCSRAHVSLHSWVCVLVCWREGTRGLAYGERALVSTEACFVLQKSPNISGSLWGFTGECNYPGILSSSSLSEGEELSLFAIVIISCIKCL